MANDYSYFERNEKGEPVKFVEHHESHSHDGKNPHEHEVDLKDATVGDTYNRNWNDKRTDR